ncbi:MAG: hypothetical protein PHV66_07940 [Bacteroidales bacterium]|nr:hypothetical protein [Bacteroidales bacterium]
MKKLFRKKGLDALKTNWYDSLEKVGEATPWTRRSWSILAEISRLKI